MIVAILLSFDIDGTLELGEPPGGVTMEMVRRAHDLGYLVGSCSDRALSSQLLNLLKCVQVRAPSLH